jgi:hypothetical protein
MRMSRAFWVVAWLDGLLGVLSHHYGWPLRVQAGVAFPINLVGCVLESAHRSRVRAAARSKAAERADGPAGMPVSAAG